MSVFLLFFCVFTVNGTSNTLTFTVKLPPSNLKVIRVTDSFVRLWYPGVAYPLPEGAPDLPQIPLHFVIPSGSKAVSVHIISIDTVSMNINAMIIPSQGYIPVGFKGSSKFKLIDDEYYSKSEYTPGILNLVSSGNMSGYSLASLLLSPVIYYPKDSAIAFITKIRFSLEYVFDSIKTVAITEKQRTLFNRLLKNIIYNPSDLDKFAPPLKKIDGIETDMVIITADSLRSYFEPLMAWKQKRGIRCEIVSVESIYENYLGVDKQAKIRTFLKDYHSNRGLIYVLLGGKAQHQNGDEIIPIRKTYFAPLGFFAIFDTIPSDLYYSDLDGSWDFNKNRVYGEIGDSVDMYPDVIVGRLPIQNGREAINVVKKILKYEIDPERDYLNNVYLLAEYLYPDFGYWGDTVCDSISGFIQTPPAYDIKLYTSLGTLDRHSVMHGINAGGSFFAYSLHGNEYGTSYFDVNDIDDLMPNQEYGIHTAISSFLGAMDFVPDGDCYAEKLLNKEDGGSIANIMNTRLGWGAYIREGPSERIMQSFYKHVFVDSFEIIGLAHIGSLLDWVPLAHKDNYYRYCIYESTLFGDPSLTMWTIQPLEINVYHPLYVDVTSRVIPIRCNTSEAVAVLSQDNQTLYKTTISGVGSLNLPDTLHEGDSLNIVVLSHNSLPYIGSIMVQSRDSFNSLFIADAEFIDENYTHEINPGGSVYLRFVVINNGVTSLQNIYGKITSSDSFIRIYSDSSFISSMFSVGDSIYVDSAFLIRIADEVPDNYFANLGIEIVASEKTFKKNINMRVIRTCPKIVGYNLLDSFPGDNNNGLLDPGELATLSLYIDNYGYGNDRDLKIKFISSDSFLSILDTIKVIDSIPPLGRIEAGTIVGLDSMVSQPVCSYVSVQIMNKDTFWDSIPIFANQGIYHTTIEDTLGDIPVKEGEWHITYLDYYSAPSSLWCGNERTGGYSDNRNSILYLPPIVKTTENLLLAFNTRYSIENYKDSALIEVSKDGKKWTEIWVAVIPAHVWHHLNIPIKYGVVGDTIYVRFRLFSDKTVHDEGWFIDDITFGPGIFIPALAVDSVCLQDEAFNNNVLDENEEVSFKILLRKTGLGNIYNLEGILKCLSGNAIVQDSLVHYGDVITVNTEGDDYFKIKSGKIVEGGKKIDFRLYLSGEGYSDSLDFSIVIGGYVGPDEYGYYGYSIYSPYSHAPGFKWIEIGHGFRYSQELLNNKALDTVNLPFNFRFYGKEYRKVIVSPNGWLGFGEYSSNYSDNTVLPDTCAPNNIIAGLWYYMNPNLFGSGKVYYFEDCENHRVIFEWDDVCHYIGAPNRFEIILYDPDYYPTLTGDGIILIQYYRYPVDEDFAIGIENESGSIGLTYYRNGNYADGAYKIESSYAIKFTTDAPFKSKIEIPDRLTFVGPYPSIASDLIKFKFNLPYRGKVSLDLYDLIGRKVLTLLNRDLPPGHYTWNFDIKQSRLRNGVYFSILQVKDTSIAKKFIIVK